MDDNNHSLGASHTGTHLTDASHSLRFDVQEFFKRVDHRVDHISRAWWSGVSIEACPVEDTIICNFHSWSLWFMSILASMLQGLKNIQKRKKEMSITVHDCCGADLHHDNPPAKQYSLVVTMFAGDPAVVAVVVSTDAHWETCKTSPTNPHDPGVPNTVARVARNYWFREFEEHARTWHSNAADWPLTMPEIAVVANCEARSANALDLHTSSHQASGAMEAGVATAGRRTGRTLGCRKFRNWVLVMMAARAVRTCDASGRPSRMCCCLSRTARPRGRGFARDWRMENLIGARVPRGGA